MVKRDSKYKTNKKVSKDNAANVNQYVAYHETHKKQHEADPFTPTPGDEEYVKTYNKKTGQTTFKVFTDNEHYEVVDKKAQRKKKNRTMKSSSDEEEKLSSPTSKEPAYKVLTVGDAKQDVTPSPLTSLAPIRPRQQWRV